jgi:hypothetical protein
MEQFVRIHASLQFGHNANSRMTIRSSEAHLEAPKTYELQLKALA